MSTTTCQSLRPDLRLALLAACEATDPTERGQRRAQQWTTRLTISLGALALCIALLDLALLTGM